MEVKSSSLSEDVGNKKVKIPMACKGHIYIYKERGTTIIDRLLDKYPSKTDSDQIVKENYKKKWVSRQNIIDVLKLEKYFNFSIAEWLISSLTF